MALSKTTQDHDEIRQWAEARGAKPAEVASTESSGQIGIIRLEFPNAPHANDSALKEISWDEFFEKFDSSGLALVYQDQTAEGEQSNFNRLIHPEADAAAPVKKVSAKKTPASKIASKAPAKAKTPSAKASSRSTSRTVPVKTTGAKSAKKAAPAKAFGKATGKKTPAKSASGKKTTAKKAVASKAPAKKTAPKKTAAKAVAKKTAAKKAAGARSKNR